MKEKKMPIGSPTKKKVASKATKPTKGTKFAASASSGASAALSRRPSLTGDIPSADFEAGLLFERFGGATAGKLDALAFQRMWREREKLQQLRKAMNAASVPLASVPASGSAFAAALSNDPFQPPPRPQEPLYSVPPTDNAPGIPLNFEAGQLFERFDHDHDGRLTRSEFETLLNDYLRSKANGSSPSHRQQPPPPAVPTAPPPSHAPMAPLPPVEPSAPPAPLFDPPPPYIAMPPKQQPPSSLPPPPYPPIPRHEPIPPPPPPAPSLSLASLTHFNETTGVPLPADAVQRYANVYGHVVVPIADAYGKRMRKLRSLMTAQLLPRRELLLQIGRKVRVIEGQVKSVKATIEREIVADSSAILERLRSAEALKTAALSHQMNEVMADLEAVDRLVTKIDPSVGLARDDDDAAPVATPYMGQNGVSSTATTRGAAEMLEVIQSFPELLAAIDRAVAKDVHAEVSVSPDDFRRETAERLEVLRRCDRYEQALAVKDQMVWTLLQERQRLEGLQQAEEGLREEYTAEIVEWMELTDRLSQEVAQLRTEVAEMPGLRETNVKLKRENEALVDLLTKAGLGKWTPPPPSSAK